MLQVHKAVAVAQALQVQGMQLDAQLLTGLLSAAIQLGAWDDALRLCSAAHVAQASRGGGAGRCVCVCVFVWIVVGRASSWGGPD